MKHLVMLLAAATVMVVAWWVIREISGRRPDPHTIYIPQNPADKPGLVRSAYQLWDARPDYYDPAQVASFLKLLAQHLDDDSWRAVSAPSFFAWGHLRGNAAIRPQFLEMEDLLLEKFLKTGALQEVAALVRMAEEKAFDTVKLTAALEKHVLAPLEPGTFPESRQELIIASAIRANALEKAALWIGKLSWNGPETPEDKNAVGRLSAVLGYCRPQKTGNRLLSKGVSAWQSASTDIVGRDLLQPNLEELTLAALDGFEATPASPVIGESFGESVTAPGADPFWAKVLSRTIPSLVKGTGARISVVAELTRLYSTRFKKPVFEFQFWMKVGALAQQWMENDPLRATEFYTRARSAATTDLQRVLVAQKLTALYSKANEFPTARTIAEETEKAVADPEQKKSAALLVADARKKESADLVRVQLQEKAIDLDRRRGRLQSMKDNLSAAKRSGRPTEQLQAIEKEIKTLELQLTE